MTVERSPARNFRDLLVWQKAHRWVLALYVFTGVFPKHETYGLNSSLLSSRVTKVFISMQCSRLLCHTCCLRFEVKLFYLVAGGLVAGRQLSAAFDYRIMSNFELRQAGS